MIHFGGEVLSEKLVSESDSSEDLPETDEFSETPQDSTVDNFNLASDSVNLDEITEAEGRSVDLMDLSSVKERIENICGILSKWKALDTKRSRESYIDELKKLVTVYYGYSEELSDYFFKLFNPLEAIQFFDANEQPLPLTIRTNTLKTKRKDLAVSLINRGANVDPIGDWTKEGLVVHSSKVPIGATPEYLAGHYILQSASSLIPVLSLAPRPNELVLDMCAAPGGKTTHIGQLMNNTGILFANDSNKSRCKSLVSNIHRLGILNSIVCNYKGDELVRVLPKMDRILLDAPCSGLGVISRDPSIKVKRGLKDLQRNSNLQKQLLTASINLVKPNGIIVYSTCSLSIEENEQVIHYAIRKFNVKLVPLGLEIGTPAFSSFRGRKFHPSIAKFARRFYPHKHSLDGFFVAKLIKLPNSHIHQNHHTNTDK
ncbi:NOL1/NOP2/sun family putative RNA methylase domain protein [Theileria parva strain Muguga]|uniref:Nuclear protein, putative n=1 Tax=Theileria parva TaxID=5875 RepID=Q4N4T2_THEPA|nr:NOL1/NOP2/sun family putative RNA methylase domain protein [Theileria parva strain Muguga]EAN32841.1 NOL1/NOP2/sun family putative RNA methylase domain protein [Theileria parva strain Muguga]|eukprot:XP_765124.1 nuclear protein [Theileria parva strain Muguga]